MDVATDEELARRWLADDTSAFDAIFRRYAPRLLGLFRRGGADEPVAQDLLQQTFLHVHRARRDFRRGVSLRPWLFAIACNVQREHWRRRSRRPEAALDDATSPSVDPGASTPRERLVRRALGQLPDAQREVIVLHWFEDLTFPEIAAVLGASVPAVKVRAHRGYEALRALLAPVEAS